MAYKLIEYAEEIKGRKISTFKRNMQMKQVAEFYRESGNYTKLIQWMTEVREVGK